MLKKKFLYFFILLFLFIILNFSKVYANNSTIIDTYNNVDLSYAYTVSNGNDFIICRNASHTLYELFIVPSNTTCHIVRENHFAFFDSDNNKLNFDYCTINVQNSSAVFGIIRHSSWTDNGITDNENGGCVFFSTVDIYDLDSTIFFRGTPLLTPLGEIVVESNPIQILTQLIQLLPLIIVVVVSLVGLRKALTLLLAVFHKA